MATSHGGLDVSLATTAAAVGQYKVVKGSSTGVLHATTTSETTILGVAQEDVGSAGGTISVRISGTSKYVAGGTIHIGDKLTCGAAGVVIATTTSGHSTIGQSLQEAVTGDVFEGTVCPGSV